MYKYMRPLAALLFTLALALSPAFSPLQTALCAAASTVDQAPAAVPETLTSLRIGPTATRVRIVLDLSGPVTYTDFRLSGPDRLVVDLAGLVNQSGQNAFSVNDPVVKGVRLGPQAGKLRLVVDINAPVPYKIFALTNPDRLVIDVFKTYESRVEREVRPGLVHTAITRGTPAGPQRINALIVDPAQGWVMRPILSNDAVPGLETVSAMAARTGAVAAINAPYFAPNGEIIGLLKMDGTIVSTPLLARTAYGQDAAGRKFIAQVAYQGTVVLPDGRTVPISGVNRERGENELILYNNYYGPSTRSNGYGREFAVQGGKVTAVGQGNTPIPPQGYVLSAHGTAAQALADLKVGDAVTVRQTLGAEFDQAVYAVGAGPTLVKEGRIFLTTAQEAFPPDIAVGRAPRSALGLTRDGRLILVVVDGRQADSIGMTLAELATLLQELGAVDAMNLDGGGSSDLVIDGHTVNNPSDGRERKVGAALGIFPTVPPQQS